MVNLLTGPKGSGKTQQMIDLANEKVKTSSGNVVFIKRSHKDTYSEEPQRYIQLIFQHQSDLHG